jgi:hypothetical protein
VVAPYLKRKDYTAVWLSELSPDQKKNLRRNVQRYPRIYRKRAFFLIVIQVRRPCVTPLF